MALLAPSRAALQRMINLCSDFCQINCLSFNAKKSKVMIFGKTSTDSVVPLVLGGSTIDYVDEWKYLGTTIKSGRSLGFNARPDIASFFRACNSVIHSLPGAHEHTLVMLLYSNCVLILTYTCAVKEYSASHISNCNTAINKVNEVTVRHIQSHSRQILEILSISSQPNCFLCSHSSLCLKYFILVVIRC